jgi:hypothetical protein
VKPALSAEPRGIHRRLGDRWPGACEDGHRKLWGCPPLLSYVVYLASYCQCLRRLPATEREREREGEGDEGEGSVNPEAHLHPLAALRIRWQEPGGRSEGEGEGEAAEAEANREVSMYYYYDLGANLRCMDLRKHLPGLEYEAPPHLNHRSRHPGVPRLLGALRLAAHGLLVKFLPLGRLSQH